MLDPIQITITDVTIAPGGLQIDCLWQWGSRKPQELLIFTDGEPATATDVREIVTKWVLGEAEEDYRLAPLQNELMGDGWTIDFEEDEEPFEATRSEISIMFMLRRAAEAEEN